MTEKKEKYCLLASVAVNAGFPSPATDYMEGELDLNQFLIRNPDATFFVRVNGDSMINAGIMDNDILIVDRSLQSRNGSIILAVVDGEFTVKRLAVRNGLTLLVPENPIYSSIDVTANETFQVWGVVTSTIHKFV